MVSETFEPDEERPGARWDPSEERLVVDLDGFEGPLDLLLVLAREQKVDLARISLLQLADQYAAYIERAHALKLEIAADYLVMAAWLVYLKSRLLLPEPGGEDEPTGEDFDGVVAVAHTEGGGTDTPNNRDLLLRTLAGFAVHPNVGALLCVDYGSEAVSNVALEQFLRVEGYAIDDLPHRFLSLGGGFDRHLVEAEAQAREWAQRLRGQTRVDLPASQLKLALQCGGSDAFSGVSGNPLAAWVALPELRAGRLVAVRVTEEGIRRSWWAVTAAGETVPRSVRAFVELLRSELPSRVTQSRSALP